MAVSIGCLLAIENGCALDDLLALFMLDGMPRLNAKHIVKRAIYKFYVELVMDKTLIYSEIYTVGTTNCSVGKGIEWIEGMRRAC